VNNWALRLELKAVKGKLFPLRMLLLLVVVALHHAVVVVLMLVVSVLVMLLLQAMVQKPLLVSVVLVQATGWLDIFTKQMDYSTFIDFYTIYNLKTKTKTRLPSIKSSVQSLYSAKADI